MANEEGLNITVPIGVENIDNLTKPLNSQMEFQKFIEQNVGDEVLGSRTLGTAKNIFSAPSSGFGGEYDARNLPILKDMGPVTQALFNVVAPYGEKAFDIADTIFRLPGAAAADIAELTGSSESDVNKLQAEINTMIGLFIPQTRTTGMASAATNQVVNAVSKSAQELNNIRKFIPEILEGQYSIFAPPKAQSVGAKAVTVDKKFSELFENNPNVVDSMGKFKASNALNELLKLNETFVLGAKNPELIKIFETKGIKITPYQMSNLRTLYKRFTGKKKVSELINFDDPQVSNIMERLVMKELTKKDAAKLLEEIYPGSGFVDISMGGKASSEFSKFYKSYVGSLDADMLKLISAAKDGSPKSFFNALNVGDKITPKASGYLKFTAIFDDTGKSFTQNKASFLNNNIANTLINKTKNLFQDKSTKIFDVDHIQAPRFGGTNAESNLRLITNADHNTLRALPSYKTLATDVVKAKSGFENDYYKLSTKLIDNIKNNNFEAADKIAESLRVMVDNFKNTYKNVDFVVGTPHVAIKTGNNTAKYIKYSDDVKLSTKQKKYIEDNNLLPTQSNLPNAGKPIEKQAEDIYQGYLQIYNLIGEIPSGSIGKVAGDIKSMDVPLPRDVVVRKEFSGLRDGGIVDIFKMTRPLV